MSAIVFYLAVVSAVWLIVAVVTLFVILPALQAASEYDDATGADETPQHLPDITYRGRPVDWLHMSCTDHDAQRR